MAPVQQHGTLVSLARWRSSDMLAKNYFSHTIAGCGCLVYAYYDSNGLSYDWAGENIGWNSGPSDAYSPVRVHEQFMASAGHRANVLDPRFTHGGVGAAAADGKMFQGYVQNTRMYTELFMQASGGAPRAAAPAPQLGRWRWWRRRWRRRPGGPVRRGSAPKPKPKPSPGDAWSLRRARESSAGIDGVIVVVSAPSRWRAPAPAARRRARRRPRRRARRDPAGRRADGDDSDHGLGADGGLGARPRRSPACSTASSARCSASSSADRPSPARAAR